ncbi:MAG TPA: thioredoxin family protein [Candidatus Polarisedimenticolaceae bacterium]|nr:thioredoxin family protein [Candidatus Polarisedimenticolaceae bacterium]
MSIHTMLAGFVCVTLFGAMPAPVASASPEETPAVKWSYTISGTDASASSHLNGVLASARAAQRPVMIEFYAAWCAACRLLDRNAYSAPDVIQSADRFVTIRVDTSNGGEATDVLAKRFGVRGLPTVAFVSSRGAALASSNIVGLVDASTLARELRKIP